MNMEMTEHGTFHSERSTNYSTGLASWGMLSGLNSVKFVWYQLEDKFESSQHRD